MEYFFENIPQPRIGWTRFVILMVAALLFLSGLHYLMDFQRVQILIAGGLGTFLGLIVIATSRFE